MRIHDVAFHRPGVRHPFALADVTFDNGVVVTGYRVFLAKDSTVYIARPGVRAVTGAFRPTKLNLSDEACAAAEEAILSAFVARFGPDILAAGGRPDGPGRAGVRAVLPVPVKPLQGGASIDPRTHPKK